MDVQYNLDLFKQMVSCNYPIHFTSYDSELNPLTPQNETDFLFDLFISMGKRKEHLHKNMQRFDVPVLFDNSLGLTWAADFECQGQKPMIFHVMGPIFIYENSSHLIEKALDDYQLSIHTKYQFIQTLHTIPMVPVNIFYQYVAMFHYCLTGQKVTFTDFDIKMQQGGEKHAVKSSSVKKMLETNPGHLGVYKMETRLMKIVEEGRLDYQETQARAAYASNGIKADLPDQLQRLKYSSSSLLTLASRAAIRGGMPAATAYSLNDTYLEQIDSCETANELANLNHHFYHDFVQRVHDLKRQSEISRPVQTCIDYISMHITDKIDTSTLSSLVGYSDCYLSRKFKNETGSNVKQYILSAKIEYAKVQLASTDYSVLDIGSALGFCSRSHFSNTFNRQVGMSPQQYRETHGRH